MTWVCRFLRFRCRLHQQACSHRQSWPSQQWTFPSRKSRMPSFPASSSLSSSSFSLPPQTLADISLSKLTMPYFRQDNSATLAAHPTDNQENPIVFLDINVGGAPLGTYSGNRHNQETFFILFFSPQMSTPAASWSSCLPMWFQGLLRTSVFFAPVRRRSRAFTTEALSFTEWSTGWCLFSKSWTWI